MVDACARTTATAAARASARIRVGREHHRAAGHETEQEAEEGQTDVHGAPPAVAGASTLRSSISMRCASLGGVKVKMERDSFGVVSQVSVLMYCGCAGSSVLVIEIRR